MTVQDLINRLAAEDPSRIVVLSRDGEGNGYSPLSSVERYDYDAEEREIGFNTITPELEAQGYDEDDEIEGVPALVLWPV